MSWLDEDDEVEVRPTTQVVELDTALSPPQGVSQRAMTGSHQQLESTHPGPIVHSPAMLRMKLARLNNELARKTTVSNNDAITMTESVMILQHRYHLTKSFNDFLVEARAAHLSWLKILTSQLPSESMRNVQERAVATSEERLQRAHETVQVAARQVNDLRNAADLVLRDPGNDSFVPLAVSKATTVEGKIDAAVSALENATTRRAVALISKASAQVRSLGSDVSSQFWGSREEMRSAERRERRTSLQHHFATNCQSTMNAVAALRSRREDKLDTVRRELAATAQRMADRVASWTAMFRVQTADLVDSIDRAAMDNRSSHFERKLVLHSRLTADDVTSSESNVMRVKQFHRDEIAHLANLHAIARSAFERPVPVTAVASSIVLRASLFPAIPSLPEFNVPGGGGRIARRSERNEWDAIFANYAWTQTFTRSTDAHAELTLALEKTVSIADSLSAALLSPSVRVAFEHLILEGCRWGTELRATFGSLTVKDADAEVLQEAVNLPTVKRLQSRSQQSIDIESDDARDVVNGCAAAVDAVTSLCDAVRGVSTVSDGLASDLGALSVERGSVEEQSSLLERKKQEMQRKTADVLREHRECEAFYRTKMDELHRALAERDRVCTNASISSTVRLSTPSVQSSALNSTTTVAPQSIDSLQTARVAFSHYSADVSS